ncbi:MAG: aspartate aminotransferase family protein [Bacteroidetes bacterium]|nr:aspartate aminotransferase family protein [Bacteroidota bacterium]
MNNRYLFFNHIGQTSPAPLAIEIVHAHGNYLMDAEGRQYLDLIGGISVANIGHGNKKVISAIKKQAEKYLHVMVNGELVLSPQTRYAKLLTDHLPASLNAVFFTASGTEATEGAMKLAKRFTGRSRIAAFKNSYHGSTQGSLSILGDERWRNAFRPLLPDVLHLDYNSFDSLNAITNEVACVIAESVQAEAGVIVPDVQWMQALRNRCTETGTLLVLDEIQCGFGRNGTLWAFEQYGIVPDILLLGKALGGGMPLGCFIADKKIMDAFMHNPVLGHINTFGGHPVCCAAGEAAMKYLLNKKLVDKVFEKEKLFRRCLRGLPITIRSKGLMMALSFQSFDENKKIIDALMAEGLFTDWFLFADNCLRIAPPLTITKKQIRYACQIIKNVATISP